MESKINEEQWIMTDTDESPLSLNVNGNLYYIGRMDSGYIKSDNHQPKFLHLVNKEEPKLGDWVVDGNGYLMVVAEINETTGIARGLYSVPFVLDGCKKIIASTNTRIHKPLIPEAMVKLFIDKQGKVGEVEIMLLECSCDTWGKIMECEHSFEEGGRIGMCSFSCEMKLTVDKEIIIVDALEFIRGEVKEVKITEAPHIKRVYSEHEVKSAMYDSWCSSRDELPQSFDIFYDKWINKK